MPHLSPQICIAIHKSGTLALIQWGGLKWWGESEVRLGEGYTLKKHEGCDKNGLLATCHQDANGALGAVGTIRLQTVHRPLRDGEGDAAGAREGSGGAVVIAGDQRQGVDSGAGVHSEEGVEGCDAAGAQGDLCGETK